MSTPEPPIPQVPIPTADPAPDEETVEQLAADPEALPEDAPRVGILMG